MHKGYATPEHAAALRRHGPCRVHRFSYANVAAVVDEVAERGTVGVASGVAAPGSVAAGDNVCMEGGVR
jgi:ribonuclease HII